MMEASMAARFARIGAAEYRGVESPAEAERLLDTILSCSNPEFTASGHRIMTVLSPDGIDKLFN